MQYISTVQDCLLTGATAVCPTWRTPLNTAWTTVSETNLRSTLTKKLALNKTNHRLFADCSTALFAATTLWSLESSVTVDWPSNATTLAAMLPPACCTSTPPARQANAVIWTLADLRGLERSAVRPTMSATCQNFAPESRSTVRTIFSKWTENNATKQRYFIF
jgi:hypothetical protein